MTQELIDLLDKKMTLAQAKRLIEYHYVAGIVERTGSVIKAAIALQTSGVEVQSIIDGKGQWTRPAVLPHIFPRESPVHRHRCMTCTVCKTGCAMCHQCRCYRSGPSNPQR